jgi:cytosine/adenosine deaminase-related metal-dependent hydrolase
MANSSSLAASDRPLALRARYVFPIDAPPLIDGVLTIAGERIVAVGENLAGRPPLDLGNAAILPGLVNAHTHLEFSDLTAPLGQRGMSLPQWIRQVLAARGPRQDSAAAIRRGLHECLAAGTTALGDIVTSGWSPPATRADESYDDGIASHENVHVTLFRELIGLSPERAQTALTAAEQHLDAWQGVPGFLPGLSPHAPYTVHPDLLRRAVELARQRRCPLAMHVAESREELELLAAGTGPLAELLKERGVWKPDLFGRRRVVEILHALAAAPRALVIHGNYLAAEDVEVLTAEAARLTLVYCPRTHAYFGHEAYPLARLLAAGVQMALGTDSRASNPDLSLLAEMRCVAERHPGVSPAKILELGTLAGARALGLERDVGSLAPGKLANLAIVQISGAHAAEPHALLFDSAARVVQTWFHGRPVHP